MIDVHCHILPGIDDGPKTLDESLQMARIFEQTGFTHVVATPHVVPGTRWMPGAVEIRERLSELNQAIAAECIKLKVLPGMEIALDPNIANLLDQGQVQPLAGTSYLLIEPPFQQLPLGWEHVIFDLLSRGFAVFLAHPERCAQLAARPQLCDQLIESGVYFQVNWNSFLGHNGRTAEKMAVYLAERGFIHCLATDSHGAAHRSVLQITQAAARIEKIVGSRNLEIISKDNPNRVLNNEVLLSMYKLESEANPPRKRKWMFWRKAEIKLATDSHGPTQTLLLRNSPQQNCHRFAK
jgi:protein-tyrosine phosphatase